MSEPVNGKVVQISTKLPVDLAEKLQRAAELDDRSVSSVVRLAVRQYVEVSGSAA